MPTADQAQSPRAFHARNARDLGAAVKHFRTLAGLTQAQLSSKAGLHRSYLSDLERGHSTEALERLMALFRELGVRMMLAREDA